ncbi:10134_t:CDS:2, partial [Dentiscutata heterogama]
DLKYNKCEYTTKELKKIVQELNKDKLEEVIIKDNQVESDDEIELDYDSDSLQLKDQHFEINNNIEIELSEPDSDDSKYTFRQKKRKFTLAQKNNQ